jgi:hypothetical protein
MFLGPPLFVHFGVSNRAQNQLVSITMFRCQREPHCQSEYRPQLERLSAQHLELWKRNVKALAICLRD